MRPAAFDSRRRFSRLSPLVAGAADERDCFVPPLRLRARSCVTRTVYAARRTPCLLHLPITVDPPLKIETERLTLRRWRPGDAGALVAMHADPDVTAWLARGPMSFDEAEAVIARFEAHFDAHGFGVWAIERRADGALIGLCGLSREVRDEHPMAPCVEIMWRQARTSWGHGHVAEAAAAVLVDGFGRVGLGEIFAWTAAANQRSERVAQQLGMARQPMRDFEHPALPPGHALRPHVVFVAHATPVRPDDYVGA